MIMDSAAMADGYGGTTEKVFCQAGPEHPGCPGTALSKSGSRSCQRTGRLPKQRRLR